MALFDNLNRKKTGVLPYVLLLTVAIVILFFISNTSFQQNRALRQSTELVSHTQEVITEINMMFGNYSKAQFAGIKFFVSRDSSYFYSVTEVIEKNKLSIERLQTLTADNPEQQKSLKRLIRLSDDFFSELQSFNAKADDTSVSPLAVSAKMQAIEPHYKGLEALQSQMIANEYELLELRKADYRSDMTFTPINILYLALFALGILMFAFSKINSDRKKMALTQSFLQNILENTDNMVNYLVPIRNDGNKITDFEITYVNSQVKAVTGRAAMDMTGKTLSEVYPYEVHKGIIELLIEVLHTKKTKSREINYEVEGDNKWFMSTFAPMNEGITATSRDITAEKAAEDNLKDLNSQLKLQNSEQRRTSSFLQNMLESIQYVVSYFEAVRDTNGTIIDFKIAYTNEKIFELTGRRPNTMLGKLISVEYPRLFENGDFEIYCEVIETGQSIEYEKDYDLENGHFSFCNEVLKLDDGITIVSQDITLRKEAEDKLERVSERLALQNTVLSDAESAAGLGSYSYNLSTDTLTYSDNCFRLLGMNIENDVPSLALLTSLIHSNDKERFEKSVAASLEDKQDVRNVYRVNTMQGLAKDIVMEGHFFKKNGEHFMVGILRDITKDVSNELILQKHNRELERSNAELESFNRVVSHDLQEPVRKIQMFISRLSDFDLENLSERGKKYLSKIDSSANRMQLLIRNLLSYAKLADEVESLNNIDLNLVLDKVLDDLSEKINDTQAKIDIPELPSIYGTEFQLEQLFNNLLSNALKYKKHDQAPEIKIAAEILPFHKIDESYGLHHSKYVFITVADNGVGFESDQSANIFRLFQRLHQKNAYEGTGLGLAICKKIVENHRGHISAQSEPSKGTEIHIYFPYRV